LVRAFYPYQIKESKQGDSSFQKYFKTSNRPRIRLRQRSRRSAGTSTIGSKEEASQHFIRLINELQAVLPSDRWRGEETQSAIDVIRSYTYEDRNSDARIDIDFIGQLEMEGDYSYLIAIFGWAATEPRL
jgi:hypothetical protein